jgi:prepilin-type processing-associated H-X9-DG protein
MRLRQRPQDMRLPRQVLARALQRAAVFEFEVHAVGHFLAVLVGDVRGVEPEQGVAFCNDAGGLLRVGVRIWGGKSTGKIGEEAYTSVQFRGGEDKNPLWLDGHVAAFPELGGLLAAVSYRWSLKSAY